MKEEKPPHEDELHRQIHNLATRLPWIVVGIVIIAAILILLQAFFLS